MNLYDITQAQIDQLPQGRAELQARLEHTTPTAQTDNETVQRTDAKWRRAAQAYAQLKRESDLLAEKLEVARQALLALAQHQKESGAGVTVMRYWKQGNVDYKRIPALQGLDLSPWRGKSREEVRVTLS